MKIECPACAARYLVPEDVVRPGRGMRCARCGETWTPRLAAPAPAGVAPAWAEGAAGADEVGAGRSAPEVAGPPGARLVAVPARAGGPTLAAAWVASGVVVLALAWGVWHFHVPIERAWPPSERLLGR